jgi:raffinose/stachyose/melibiose transport system permease protein
MVQNKAKRWTYFALFVLPALALYVTFFIVPFANGVRISFTNWDGLTPKSPISMEKSQFEARILDRIQSEADRKYILSVYALGSGDDSYRRLSLRGLERVRVEHIIGRTGYEPPRNRNVGFRNYLDIFGGKLKQNFYPRIYTQLNFSKTSDLPDEIRRKSFESDFLSRLDEGEAALARSFYSLSGEAYALLPRRSELALRNAIAGIAASAGARAERTDALLGALRQAGLSRDKGALDAAVDTYSAGERLDVRGRDALQGAADSMYELGSFKLLLAEKWRSRKLDLGVVGFTAFFALMTVALGNLLSFMLALALDTGIKTKNVLRSVFFLPNVLSMVVVALVWSFVFFHLLPKLTGIQSWMGDSGKAPWLIVLVAVWQAAGYYMVIYLAGLQNIPTDVVEAATIDGAGWWQRLRHITLPMLAPAFTICFFLSIANALKSFDLMYAMVGPSGYALGTVPLVMDIYFDAFAQKAAGMATAKAMLLFALIFLVTGIQLRAMGKKEVQL